MAMKAIMYHYVRPFDPEYPNFTNLDIKDFRKQLDYFEQTFGFVSKDDFLNSFISNKLPKGVILTFDDGLSCHYNYVFPELQRRNLWGIFYIPTSPFTKFKMLDVHRTHLLLGKFDSYEIYSFISAILTDSMLDNSKIEEFKLFTYNSQINDQYTLLVKRLMNYFIDYQSRTKIMDSLMKHFLPNESEICNNFYLSSKQINEMHLNNMVIGSHTVNHPVMSRLNEAEQEFEIAQSFKYLESVTSTLDHKTFCYPYGGFHSFNDITIRLLNNTACKYSFNVEHRDIELRDLRNSPQALPRYDCNQFEHGQIRNRII